MLRLEISKAACQCEFDVYLTGSLRAGTVESGVTEFRVDLEVESTEAIEGVLKVIVAAKRGCYAERLVENPVRLVSTVTINGSRVDIDPLLRQQGT
jgi:hypothetical protein